MKKIVVLPNIHCENENGTALDSCLSFIKYYKPTHLIQLGDLCNFDSISSYPRRSEIELKKTSLSDETKAANQIIDRIEGVLPKRCVKVITGGNHEARYPAFKVKHGYNTEFAMLYRFKTWQEEYNLDKRGWASTEYGEIYELGHIIFTHGWYTGGNHAKRHLGLYHKNIIYGHTHEWQIATEKGLDGLPIMSASIGTLSKFDLDYLKGKPPVNWTLMFAHIDMDDSGMFTPHFTPIIDGKFIELGRVFQSGC